MSLEKQRKMVRESLRRMRARRVAAGLTAEGLPRKRTRIGDLERTYGFRGHLSAEQKLWWRRLQKRLWKRRYVEHLRRSCAVPVKSGLSALYLRGLKSISPNRRET